WLCTAGEVPFTCLGYVLGAAFGPIRLRIEPEPGHSPRIFWLLSARRAAPHIRRQSRNLRRV
ncbi:MAG TPA: hypothetical protein VFH15_01830, partial [Pyrinomonadaceae bacterium]|nr:hypothetical protein [Pyrinomonadaceae bacterium]